MLDCDWSQTCALPIWNEKFLLVDRMHMLAAEVDRHGAFLAGYDLGAMIGVEEKDRPNTEIFGFCVDGAGNMFFTVPVLFQAFRIGTDGKVAFFGKAGSSPGMFGVASGIAVDGGGNIFVSDKRRHVVMVFDHNFRFLQEFGGYGGRRENLTHPDDLCVDSSGKLYVSQLLKRGVSVFQVVTN
jgi:sugar lactone lactonase YvrE